MYIGINRLNVKFIIMLFIALSVFSLVSCSNKKSQYNKIVVDKNNQIYNIDIIKQIEDKKIEFDDNKISEILELLPEPSIFSKYKDYLFIDGLLTINYEDNNYEGDENSSKFGESIKENNALLLFLAIDKLDKIEYVFPENKAEFTRENIYDIFKDIPSIDNTDNVLKIINTNMRMDEFYFAHTSRIYMGATKEDVIYRNSDPDEIKGVDGITTFIYNSLGSGISDTGENTEGIKSVYYFKDDILMATQFFVPDESISKIISDSGTPIISTSIGDNLSYIGYSLHGNNGTYAYYIYEGDNVLCCGVMKGNDYKYLQITE